MGSIPLPTLLTLEYRSSWGTKNNLKLASFFLDQKLSTVRLAIATDIILDNVRLFRELKESEKEINNPVVYPVIDANNWPKTIDGLEE